MMKIIEEFNDELLSGKGPINKRKKNGLWYYYYPSGKIKQEIEYSNGLKNGTFKLLHEDGIIAMEGMNQNGKAIGIWKEYYENGQIKEEIDYRDDDFFPINFWNIDGVQLMKDGTGKKIEEYGAWGGDVYEQYYNEGKFVKEIKIKGYKFLGFFPKEKKD